MKRALENLFTSTRLSVLSSSPQKSRARAGQKFHQTEERQNLPVFETLQNISESVLMSLSTKCWKIEEIQKKFKEFI